MRGYHEKRVKFGDLVTMYTHDTGLIGIVLTREPKAYSTSPAQIGIKWFNVGGSFEWEPVGWLEVISEA